MPGQRYLSYVFLLALVSALLVSSHAVAEEYMDGWVLEVEERGVKLFTKQTEKSPIKSYRAVTQVRANLSSLVGLLSDASRLPQWMDKVVEAQTLRQISERESLVYQVFAMPWPARDHDTVLYSRWQQDPKSFVVTKELIAEPQYLAQVRGRERHQFFQGRWQLTPLQDGVVEVVYSAEVDPGSDRALNWMENMLVYEMPMRTLQNMRAQALDRYAGFQVAYIKEPSRAQLARLSE